MGLTVLEVFNKASEKEHPTFTNHFKLACDAFLKNPRAVIFPPLKDNDHHYHPLSELRKSENPQVGGDVSKPTWTILASLQLDGACGIGEIPRLY